MCENATRLSATIKSALKLALAEMWQAELRLRTHLPLTGPEDSINTLSKSA